MTPEFGNKSKAFSYAAPCESDDEEEIVLSMWGVAIESDDEDDISSLGMGSEEDISQSESPPPDDAKSESFVSYHYTNEGRKEVFYLTTHSTHFIYGYMASDIW